jgi:hypothetical protein
MGQWEHEFDETLSEIEFPLKLSDVSKFAKRTNMSINVYCYDNGCIAALEVLNEERENMSILSISKIMPMTITV